LQNEKESNPIKKISVLKITCYEEYAAALFECPFDLQFISNE
jgi:hypothetical protein